MARPLPLSDPHRMGTNGPHGARPAPSGPLHLRTISADEGTEIIEPHRPSRSELAELEQVRSENAELRALCQELEQALHEAAQQLRPDLEQQVRDYEAVAEEKNETIRQLHQRIQEMATALDAAEASAAQAAPSGRAGQDKLPSEAELMALSEQLEHERQQLREDEQALMEQMREMEVSMARERAELARQRNDLQRLQSEIRHELERLERDGGIQSKIEGLRNRLHDTTARRGAAPASANNSKPTTPSSRKEGLMGRLFKRNND